MVTAVDRNNRVGLRRRGNGPARRLPAGLTFDRRTWRPLTELLDGSGTSIPIDLPARGGSGGEPADVEDIANQIQCLPESLWVEPFVVVGHSMSVAIAAVFASAYPARGVVMVDMGTEVLPLARMLHLYAMCRCRPDGCAANICLRHPPLWRPYPPATGRVL